MSHSYGVLESVQIGADGESGQTVSRSNELTRLERIGLILAGPIAEQRLFPSDKEKFEARDPKYRGLIFTMTDESYPFQHDWDCFYQAALADVPKEDRWTYTEEDILNYWHQCWSTLMPLLDQAMPAIRAVAEELARKGKLSAEEVKAIVERIDPTGE